MKPMLLTKSYKDNDGWHKPGQSVGMSSKEARRIANKGGCVEVVTQASDQSQDEKPAFTVPFDAIRDAIEKGEVTGDGAPTTDAMAERMGRPFSAKERNVLYVNYMAE